MRKFIMVLIYDVIMTISTIYTGRYCTVLDVTQCGMASHIYVDLDLLNRVAILYCRQKYMYVISVRGGSCPCMVSALCTVHNT
jgi:hypothetical protein